MRARGWVVLLGLGAGLSACAGTPKGLPGTATCDVGRSEQTIACQDICARANSARSQSDREDLVACARDQCDQDCR